MDVIEKQWPTEPAENATAAEKAEYRIQYTRFNEVCCLMLASMSPELQKQFELYTPYDMISELKSLYEKQAGVELFDNVVELHDMKLESRKPVSSHVLKMKSIFDKMESMEYAYHKDVKVGMIFKSLPNEFESFVQNYNMHSMKKSVNELHAMLIEFEKKIPKKANDSNVLMIKGGRIQKAKRSRRARGKADGNGKGKQVANPSQPKKTPPAKKEHPVLIRKNEGVIGGQSFSGVVVAFSSSRELQGVQKEIGMG
uniref:uncharacterized protein LOC122610428 n=1 Tax=Erigeron canadensis TaxID=72917 RepID=UPI001CB8EC91|nr:uncharacterized protein LOC122610428 [Erigeron canadensis]